MIYETVSLQLRKDLLDQLRADIAVFGGSIESWVSPALARVVYAMRKHRREIHGPRAPQFQCAIPRRAVEGDL